MSYQRRLMARAGDQHAPVRVGLVGAGQMGQGFASQVARIPGMEIVAVADIWSERAIAALSINGDGHNVAVTDDLASAVGAITSGRRVATTTAELVTKLQLDVIIEASGVPAVAADVALKSIMAGVHIGLLTVEADVTVGLMLAQMAERAGVVYTVCRGDEPVEAKLLVDYARDLGFEVVCAGKGKNNPLNHRATASLLELEAQQKKMNPKMLASFVDGTKTMVEMAALANATGLRVSRRGLHGPHATVEQLAEIFCPLEDGGVLEFPGVVDYATGPVAPGLFVVFRTDEPTVLYELEYLKMGRGPYYCLYRPYHLASVEAPLTVASAVLDRTPDMCPVGWTADVIACAKRDLSPGVELEGIGGSDVYGVTEDAALARADDLLPIGLVAGAELIRPVEADEPLRYSDVVLDPSATIVQLRRLQDQLFSPAREPASV